MRFKSLIAILSTALSVAHAGSAMAQAPTDNCQEAETGVNQKKPYSVDFRPTNPFEHNIMVSRLENLATLSVVSSKYDKTIGRETYYLRPNLAKNGRAYTDSQIRKEMQKLAAEAPAAAQIRYSCTDSI